MVMKALQAAVGSTAKFLFTTKTGVALTAGTVGLNLGQNSAYAMHPGMGMMGMYGGMGYM